jgi:hypothetical protein
LRLAKPRKTRDNFDSSEEYQEYLKKLEKNRDYGKTHRERYPEKVKEQWKKWRVANSEAHNARTKKWAKDNPEKHNTRNKKWRKENLERAKDIDRKSREKHSEKRSKDSKRWRKENPELWKEIRNRPEYKAKEKARQSTPEYKAKAKETRDKPESKAKAKAHWEKWRKDNLDHIKGYKKKYHVKNPTAHSPESTAYRRSQEMCEWSYCEQDKQLNVHHILLRSKYPDYADGNYHGSKNNNFICYCPFHHFAYHYVYAKRRNDKNHHKSVSMLWSRVEKWGDDNHIDIGDLEIELAMMLGSTR